MVDNGVHMSHDEAINIVNRAITERLPLPYPDLERDDLRHMAYLLLRHEREGQHIYGLAIFAPNPEAYMVIATRHAVLRRCHRPEVRENMSHSRRVGNHLKVDPGDDFQYTPQMVRKALPYVFDPQPLREAGGYMPRENQPDEEVGPVTTPVDDTIPMDAVCMVLDLVQALPLVTNEERTILQDYAEHDLEAMDSLYGDGWRQRFYRACVSLAKAASEL